MAKRRLYGSAANYLLATTGSSDLTDALLNAVTADPAFAGVVSRWASCMAVRGLSYSSPENLWNSLASAVALLPTVRALQARHARYFSKALTGSLAKLTHIDARALRIARALHLRLPSMR